MLAKVGGLSGLFLPHLWQTFQTERTVENLITGQHSHKNCK